MKPYFALLHYPVYDKNGELVVTSITNTDLHDLARIAKTFDLEQFFVVTPLRSQIELCQRLVGHWTHGYGAKYNHTRKDAISTLSVVSSFNCMLGRVMKCAGTRPVLVATSAKPHPNGTSYSEMRKCMSGDGRPHVILFGTGWGIHRDILERVDHILEPIYGIKDYNHLSVRCAAAIILDRLLSKGSS